ncbi:T-cell receptor-associated transmembrane adapter 1 isoform X2 [Ascaphus truei]|uniref:T-cell receptor-associated transmembrane adapter 1 isoform X2 n=1 Tax=Ascaphus truei TaxID=8439 RepID=UPI003F5A003E
MRRKPFYKKQMSTAKELQHYSQYSISYEQQYIENNPIYGNLHQPILGRIDECCYEQMATPQERNREEFQVEFEEQMCYAALDLSPKKPRKNKKKKACHIDAQDCVEDRKALKPGDIVSRSSIYLNSEQLKAESNAAEDMIHDDPIRLYHLIHKTRNISTEDQNQTD